MKFFEYLLFCREGDFPFQREFFQLNVDIFGIEGVEADLEILSIAINIMRSFGAKDNMFEIRIANRRLLDDVFSYLELTSEQSTSVRKIIDKKGKVSDLAFLEMLKEQNLSDNTNIKLIEFLNNPDKMLSELEETSKGAQEVLKLLVLAKSVGFGNLIKYNPCVVRGLDYYTGNVFEMYDLNPQNTRAMFGGGRYDDLVETFTGQKLTGTGFGWGDISMQLFLESWNLLPKFENSTQYLVTLWPQNGLKYFEASNKVAELLRSQGNTVEMWLKPETSISKQISYASKLEIKNVVIVGDEELQTNSFTTKDLITGEQTKTKLS